MKKVFLVYEDINHADVILVSCHETQEGADAECRRLSDARPRDNFSVSEEELKP